MARKYGSKRTLKQRLKDNKGVKDGTLRRGAGGKTLRRYNARTGRWQVVKVIDKKGRTRKTKKVTSASDTPSGSQATPPPTSKARIEGNKRSIPRNKPTVIDPFKTRESSGPVRNRPERGVPMRLVKERESKSPLKYVIPSKKSKYRWVRAGK